MRQYIITEAEANMILTYLAKQSYEDVFQLINTIQSGVAKREYIPENKPQEVAVPAQEPIVDVVPEIPAQAEAPAQEPVNN